MTKGPRVTSVFTQGFPEDGDFQLINKWQTATRTSGYILTLVQEACWSRLECLPTTLKMSQKSLWL